MTRLDWIVLRRIASRVGLTCAHPVRHHGPRGLARHGPVQPTGGIGGPLLGLVGIVSSSLRTSIAILPVTVLIGTIIGALDLQARREMTIIKATGASIWRVVRAPVVAALLLGVFAGFFGRGRGARSRPLPRSGNSHNGSVWLEQSGGGVTYILAANRSRASGTALDGVTVFFTGATARPDHRRFRQN